MEATHLNPIPLHKKLEKTGDLLLDSFQKPSYEAFAFHQNQHRWPPSLLARCAAPCGTAVEVADRSSRKAPQSPERRGDGPGRSAGKVCLLLKGCFRLDFYRLWSLSYLLGLFELGFDAVGFIEMLVVHEIKGKAG